MKGEKILINVSRILVVIMLLSVFTFAPVSAVAAEGETPELNDLIAQAEALKAGNEEFPLQISHTDDGSDVNKAFPWVYADELEELDDALEFAHNPLTPVNEAIAGLEEAIVIFNGKIKADGSDPYFRLDPGPGRMAIDITAPTNVWTARTPLDNRVPADFAGGTFQMIPYPFADSQGKADVLQINYVHNGTSTFGGISIQSPLSPTVNVTAGATIEFDVYYPKSAQGKYMRWRIRNTNSNLDSYLRDYPYNNLNPDWVGSYNGETWLVAHHSVTASTGSSSTFILELHGETSRPAETGMLLVANIKITAPDPNGIALPDVVNSENQSVVAPLKSLYSRENGLFMVGAIGVGTVNGIRARHYEIFVDGNNLKADATHPRGPSWLKSINGDALSGATTTPGIGEYSFPTSSYQAIRDSGTPGQYKSHAHVLAWYNQAPGWMRQMIPANLPAGYNGTTDFYGLGNGVTTTVPVDKEMARRVQFNHTMYVMRHFLTTDTKYGSSVSRGVIPFNSWDVLNEEVHESRHSELIPTDVNNWRTSLKHTNWLVAMSDDLIGGDITEHYIYLLFKYAHIAAPNAQMAAAYKANYDSLPEYMKLDGHDTDGSIDAYIVNDPPKLTYNDYGIASRSKARTVYIMVLALNTAWLSDPLYDGRPLIEDVGIQGHDSLGKTLASDNQYAMALYASLIDRGLLSGISFSEFDLKMPTNAPGGGATAPAVLNVKQSDALGYQYALMYKLFTKFAPYIDHIISWGVSGSGWQGSYVLFDGQSNANAGYYGAMNPNRFILGHSYLDEFFEGEYEKLQDSYSIDLGDLGIYTLCDKTLLRSKIAEAQELNASEYTAETWAVLQTALSDAIEVRDDLSADQPAVDAATQALQAAIDGLVKETAVTLTGSSIVLPGETFTVGIHLNNLTRTVYAQDIILTYDTGLFELVSPDAADGTEIIETDTSTPGSIRLISVSFQGVTGESTPILEVSFKAKTGVAAGSGSISITKADLGVMPEGAVIQAMLATKTVAVDAVDKTALAAAIADAQALCDSAVTGTDIGQYPEAAKATFQAAIDAAAAVNADENATQSEVDTAVEMLNQAKAAFEASVITEQPVDKSILNTAITAAQALNDSIITGIENGQCFASDKAAFQAAIDAAIAVSADENATQVEVDTAVDDLNAAMAAFEAAIISDTTGDLNDNTIIDVGDLAIVAYYYDADLAINPEAKVADINKDGVVDILDLAFIARRILN